MDSLTSVFKDVRDLHHEKNRSAAGARPKLDIEAELDNLQEMDRTLAIEKAALFRDRAGLPRGMICQPRRTRLAKAYMLVFTNSLPPPTCARFSKRYSRRRSRDHLTFRNLLIQAYCDNAQEMEESKADEGRCPFLWCPVLRKACHASSMNATHINPFTVGEVNLAYLFGMSPKEGHRETWSKTNGLIMNSMIESFFSCGRLVIFPDPTAENEFISLVLDKELMDPEGYCGNKYAIYHKRRLQFKTDARPEKRNLYVHAALHCFNRRRWAVRVGDRPRRDT